MAGVIAGTCATVIEGIIAPAGEWPKEIAALVGQIREGVELLAKCVECVKGASGTQHRDLYARKLVDMGIYLVVASLFCEQATASDRKKAVAKYWLSWRMPEIRMLAEQTLSGDLSAVSDFEILAGPVPSLD